MRPCGDVPGISAASQSGSADHYGAVVVNPFSFAVTLSISGVRTTM